MARKKVEQKEIKEAKQEPLVEKPVEKAAEKPAAPKDKSTQLREAAERLSEIEQLVTKQQKITQDDCVFLLDLLKHRTAQAKQYEAALIGVRDRSNEQAKGIAAAREVLTLWLAMRGSCDLEVFQATQALANRTVSLLNG